MKLSVLGTAAAAACLWAGGLLFVGLVNRFVPSYGWWHLRVMDSLYPEYHVAFGLGNLAIGVGYALVNGALAGALFAWLYNRFAQLGGGPGGDR